MENLERRLPDVCKAELNSVSSATYPAIIGDRDARVKDLPLVA